MAHNRNPDEDRRFVLPRPLSDFTGHVLLARCASKPCGRERVVWIDGLIPRWGQRRMDQVVETLRCRACLGRATWVQLRRPLYPGQIGPLDLCLVLRGLDVGR